MGDIYQALVLLLGLVVLLSLGIWVALVLVACGVISIYFFSMAPEGTIFATKAWDASANWVLTALPLFIWMGEILYSTRLAGEFFKLLGPWVQRLLCRLDRLYVFGCRLCVVLCGFF